MFSPFIANDEEILVFDTSKNVGRIFYSHIRGTGFDYFFGGFHKSPNAFEVAFSNFLFWVFSRGLSNPNEGERSQN